MNCVARGDRGAINQSISMGSGFMFPLSNQTTCVEWNGKQAERGKGECTIKGISLLVVVVVLKASSLHVVMVVVVVEAIEASTTTAQSPTSVAVVHRPQLGHSSCAQSTATTTSG